MAHPLALGLSGQGAGEAWGPQLPQTASHIPEDLDEALPALALQGRWREVASRCRGAATASAATADATAALTVATYHLLALIKLNMLEEAAAEMGKLCSSVGLNAEPSGSISSGGAAAAAAGSTQVPFALRRICAELPWWLGRQQEAVDRLYSLLDWCAEREQEAAAAAAAAAGTADTAAAATAAQALWRRRHRDVLLTLVNKHCRGQHFVAALALLDRLLRQDPADVAAWQEAGWVQALLGDAAAAAATLQRVEQLLLVEREGEREREEEGQLEGPAPGGPSSSTTTIGGGGSRVGSLEQQRQARERWRQQVVHRNRGLLCFLQHDYRGAAREYQASLALDAGDATAANNHALALMYCNHLPQATAALQAAFHHAPTALLQEPVVTNLASMLELGASPASLAAKQRMADWVSAAAPDDFDLSATRTLGA